MNNNRLPTLTNEQRDQILSKLNDLQIHTLTSFEMYEMKSRFHTRNFLKGTEWEFEGVEIDPWYNRSKKHRGQNLYCDCGRRVKRLYILKSRKKRRKRYMTKKLGINHFEQEAGVPVKIIREIQQGINKIDIYRDMILIDYRNGKRFPDGLFHKALSNGVFRDNKHLTLYHKCVMFKRANLPLFINDEYRLKKVVQEYNKKVTETAYQKVSKQTQETMRLVSSDNESIIWQDQRNYKELVKYLTENRDFFTNMPSFDYVFSERIDSILKKYGFKPSYNFKIAILTKLLTPHFKCKTDQYLLRKFNQIENRIKCSLQSYKFDQILLPNDIYVDLIVQTLDFNISNRSNGYSAFYSYLPIIKRYLKSNLPGISKKDYKKIAILWVINFIGNLDDDLVQPETLGSIKLVLLHTFPDLITPAFPMKLQTQLYKANKRIKGVIARKNVIRKPSIKQPKTEDVTITEKSLEVEQFEPEVVDAVYTNLFKFFLEQNPYFKMHSTERIKLIIIKVLNDNLITPSNLLAIKVLANLMLSRKVNDKYLYLKNISLKSEQTVLFNLYRGELSEKDIPDHVYCEVIQWMIDHFNKRIRHFENYDFNTYANTINNYFEKYCQYDKSDYEKIALRWTIDFLKLSVNEEDKFNHLCAIEDAFNNIFPKFEHEKIPNELKKPLITAECQALHRDVNSDE